MTDPTPPQVPLEILDRCLAGEATPDEIATLRVACQSDAMFAEFYDEITQAKDSSQDPRHAERIWPLVAAKRVGLEGSGLEIGQQSLRERGTAPTSTTVRSFPQRSPFTSWVSGNIRQLGAIVGAALVMLTGVAVVSWQYGHRSAPATQWTEHDYRTTRGQRGTITLPDGSVVSLAPESQLTFKMSETERRVYVKGRAYFRVALDVLHPFTVESDALVVRVLGTEFDVYAYPSSASRVAVNTGKVTVARKSNATGSNASAESPHILAAGESVILEENKTLVAKPVSASEFSWTQGVLVFNNVPAHVVATEIRRYYDVNITFARDIIARRHITTTLRDQPATELIDIFARALNVNYTRSGRSVTFQ